MKKFLFSIAAVLILFSSCSKDEKTKILTSIPENTSFVALVDLQKLGEGMGVTQESDGKIKVGKEMSQLVSSLDSKGAETLQDIKNNKFSFQLTYAALFEDKGDTFVTFFVDDQQAFIDELSRLNDNTKFEKDAGVWLDNHKTMGVKDNQVWIRTNGGEPLKAGQIIRFSKLGEKDSFCSVEYAQTMIDGSDDVQLYADAKSVTDLLGSDAISAKMALATVFEDASYLTGSVNFTDGKIETKLRILDKNFKPTKLAIGLDEINPGMLDSFKGVGNVFFALNVNPGSIEKLVSQYQETLKSALMLDDALISSLKNLDGTIIGSIDAGKGMEVIVPFKDAASAQAPADFLRQMGEGLTVNTENNLVVMKAGEPSGKPISSVASVFKNSYGGFVVSYNNDATELDKTVSEYVKQASLLIKKDGNGVELSLTVDTKPGRNALLSCIELRNQVEEMMKNNRSSHAME